MTELEYIIIGFIVGLVVAFLVRLLMPYSKRDLDKIAENGVTSIGFFSEDSVYEAFLGAGLSPEKAREEAKRRVFHID